MIVTLIKIYLANRSSKWFLLVTLLSLSFSLSILLTTIGIMKGFEETLLHGLAQSEGHFFIQRTKPGGFFSYDKVNAALTSNKVPSLLGRLELKGYIESQGFIFQDNHSQGILLRGEYPPSQDKLGQFFPGIGLVQNFNLVEKRDYNLIVPSNRPKGSGPPAPQILTRRYVKARDFGSYTLNDRLVYLAYKDLVDLADKPFGHINRVKGFFHFNTKELSRKKIEGEISKVESVLHEVEQSLGYGFKIRPFWDEFESLLEAAEIERGMLTIVLQVIIVMAIFNVMAFILYISEKKSQEIFLLAALGSTRKTLVRAWFVFIMGLWPIACALSLLFVDFYQWLFQNLAFFNLPMKIYHIEKLKIVFNLQDQLLVFGGGAFWLILIAYLGIKKLLHRTLLEGLRAEFS